ncbi:MAG TPA: hypothetical protein VFW94_15095 [Candidatus Acidoferrales bacterium]|nr:hypothetical protein [Candidatus Acidoferrales bacterium]
MTDNPAAFSASYADIKTIKTRGAVQIIFEIPHEAAGHALNVLGGLPDPSKSNYFAIARLNAEAKE